MKQILCAITLSLLFCKVSLAQSSAAKPSPRATSKAASAENLHETAVAKIDPVKEADIRQLLDLTGTKKMVTQQMSLMTENLKPVLTNSLPPGEYRAKLVDLFCEKFIAKADAQHFLDLVIPGYDKNFTHEEIRGLIQFYQTPLGQKSIAVLPALLKEVEEEGRKWGEDLGRQSMVEVLAEHPDLAKAVNDAQRTAPPADK